MTGLAPQQGVPVGPTTAISEPFWTGCARGELMFQRCTRCERANFTPTDVCRGCTSRDLVWVTGAGRGVVYSWTVVHRPVTPHFRVPYAVAIVDLDEGYRMLTNLMGVEPGDIHAGLRVRADPRPAGLPDGGEPARALPYFRPDPDPAG